MNIVREEPAVLITSRGHRDPLRIDPALMAIAQTRFIHLDETHTYHWWLSVTRWHLAPNLRSALVATGASYAETWPFDGPPGVVDKMMRAAFVRPAFEPSAKERHPRPQVPVRCPECERTSDTLPENPKLEIALPKKVPGYFRGHNSGVGIISQTLYRALEVAGLNRGLELFPIVTTPRTTETYFGTRARTQLRGPVAPFGSGADGGPPCDTCGRAWPRWGLYPLYERPSANEDWFWSVPLGPSQPIVTARVYRFLEADADGLVGLGPSRNRLEGSRVGWSPDELAIAFLPERFRGITDAPVEPLRPGETPWL